MDMTEKNGQPSMEEILASIRRIVAEEPETHLPHIPANGPVIDFRNNPITLNGDGVLDDSEFDLPAIFRSSTSPAPEKPGPLIGRLTDALRNATGNQPEQKQMQTADETPDRHGDRGHDGRPGKPSESYPVLSSLQPVRTNGSHGDAADGRKPEPAQTHAQPIKPLQAWGFTRAAPQPSATDGETRRVMAPFKDTHFMRMSGAPAKAPITEAPRPAVLPAVPAEDSEITPAPAQDAGRAAHFGTIVPVHLDHMSVPELHVDDRSPAGPPPIASLAQPRPEVHPEVMAPEATAAPFAEIVAAPASVAPSMSMALRPVDPVAHEVVAHEVVAHEQASLSPPPLTAAAIDMAGAHTSPPPLSHEEAQPTGSIEDTTAELLRPMLRQWLADNMPRMVEKALHIEVAESVKPGKKPAGS